MPLLTSLRPCLRPVETIMVPDERFGQALVLRDTEGITQGVVTVPAPLIPIVARLTGTLTIPEIARLAGEQMGTDVPISIVEKVCRDLDDALFLEGARYQAEKKKVRAQFAESLVREASHAGGAYHADPVKLRTYLENDCLSAAGAKKKNGAVRGVVAPHIDPWRGKVGYGHAYGLLRAGLREEVDTFVLLGTSHAPMTEPFALCRKAFDTPLGEVPADLDAIDRIASRCSFDPFADLLNHKREHSVEFQAVFVKHLVGARDVRIIPILCGLGKNQRTGESPETDDQVERFLGAVREIIDERRERTVIIAGADLAHVGPRFGDPAPYDHEARETLEGTDRVSLEMAGDVDHREFFAHVQSDLTSRRVCGLGPMYSLLRLLPQGSRGELAHYEQTIDPEEGSIVSHAAMAFYA